MLGVDPLVLATWGLVLATTLLAFFAWRSAHHAKMSAEILERTQLMESMPVLVPLPGGGVRSGGHTILMVKVTNTGRHAALNGSVQLTIGDHSLEAMPFPLLDAGGERVMGFPAQEDPFPLWGEVDTSSLTVVYRDAVGNRYRSEHVSTASGQNNVNVFRFRDGRWEPLLVADGRVEISFAELEVPDPPSSSPAKREHDRTTK
jgi:hypothetical protein